METVENHKIYIADELEWDEWNNFNSKHGNVFQSKEFAKSYKESGMKINLVLIRNNENQIAGGCYYMIPMPKLNKYFNQLRIVSGPIALNNDENIIELFLNKISKIADNEKVITIPLRTEFIINKTIFEKNRFEVSENGPSMSYVHNLNLNKEEMWKNISKTQRKKINRCKKNKIFIKEINSIEELKIFNRIYQNFALTVKNWIPIPYELFLGMYNNFKQNAKFLIAFKEEENIRIPVSAGLFLLFNRKIIYLANGTDNKYRNYHANSLLIWHMMQWGNVNEYEELDIYGVYPNPENYFEKGLNFFKSQFGGELIEKFMYTNRAISPFKIFLFKKVISPIALPIYKRFTRTK